MNKRIEFQMTDMKRIRMKEFAKKQLLLSKAVHEEQLAHNVKIENIAAQTSSSLSQIMAIFCRTEERSEVPRSFWRRLFNR